MDVAKLYALARVLRDVALAASREAGDEPLSTSEFVIIEDVSRYAPTTIGSIAARTGLAQSLVSRTVASLREAGVFRTAQDPDDRRKSLVSTAPGQTTLLSDRGSKGVLSALRDRLPGAEETELEGAIDMLGALSYLFGRNRDT